MMMVIIYLRNVHMGFARLKISVPLIGHIFNLIFLSVQILLDRV